MITFMFLDEVIVEEYLPEDLTMVIKFNLITFRS